MLISCPVWWLWTCRGLCTPSLGRVWTWGAPQGIPERPRWLSSSHDLKAETFPEQSTLPFSSCADIQDDSVPRQPNRLGVSQPGLRIPVSFLCLHNTLNARFSIRLQQVRATVHKAGKSADECVAPGPQQKENTKRYVGVWLPGQGRARAGPGKLVQPKVKQITPRCVWALGPWQPCAHKYFLSLHVVHDVCACGGTSSLRQF